MTALQQKLEDSKFPRYITKYDSTYGQVRIHMNLIKKRLPLTEAEAGDYIFLRDGSSETWYKVEQTVGKFPLHAVRFLKHQEILHVPKLCSYPYFGYENLNLKKDALYFIVKRKDMEDIIENGGKKTLDEEYSRRIRDDRRWRRSF